MFLNHCVSFKVNKSEDFLTSLVLFLAGYSTFETKDFHIIMSFFEYEGDMAKLCEDSVKIAEEKVRRQLVDIVPKDCDLRDCFDISDDCLFQDCRSDWLRNQFFKKHFHVVVCKFAGCL